MESMQDPGPGVPPAARARRDAAASGPVARVVRRAYWRLLLGDVAEWLVVSVSAALLALTLLLVIDRALGLDVPWAIVLGVAGSAALVVGVGLGVTRARRGVAVARVVDERAGLRQALSTALCVADQQDPWSRAALQSAQRAATGLKLSAALPLRAPQRWPVPLGLGAALALAWLMLPEFDALGRLAARERAQTEQILLVEAKAEVQAREQKVRELLRRANVEPGDASDDEPAAPASAEDVRRSAIRRLTTLTDRLEQIKREEKSGSVDAVRSAMRQLRQPGAGPLGELTRQMQRGDFGAARQAAQDLAQRLGTQDMPESDRARLQEQAQNLSEQLQKIAEQREDVEKKLEEAGLSPEEAQRLAGDPEALRKALEKMQNLTPEQREALARAAEAAAKSSTSAGAMARALSDLAAAAGEMSPEALEALEQLAQELDALDAEADELAQLDEAMLEAMSQLRQLAQGMPGECQGACTGDCAGTCPWSAGASDHAAQGTGGPGRGWGDSPEAAEAPVEMAKKKNRTHLGQGPIIGSTLVHGDQVRGESKAEFVRTVRQASGSASEALETMRVPPELHNAVKAYFGRLEASAATPAQDSDGPDQGGEGSGG